MRPFFHSASIFHSVLTITKKSILSGVMHNKVLHFFVVCWSITKKRITKICGAQHKLYVNFRWEIVFNNFLNLLEILEFFGDTEL